MTLALYDASVPVFVRGLKNLRSILEKARDHAASAGFEESRLLDARLYPDMFDMKRQVQIATDFGRRTVARLAQLEVPGSEDTETSFDELIQRIDAALDYIRSVEGDKMAGAEDRPLELQTPTRTIQFPGGVPYLLHFALPNFFFHLTTAYDILRHNGVELGKADFLGGA